MGNHQTVLIHDHRVTLFAKGDLLLLIDQERGVEGAQNKLILTYVPRQKHQRPVIHANDPCHQRGCGAGAGAQVIDHLVRRQRHIGGKDRLAHLIVRPEDNHKPDVERAQQSFERCAVPACAGIGRDKVEGMPDVIGIAFQRGGQIVGNDQMPLFDLDQLALKRCLLAVVQFEHQWHQHHNDHCAKHIGSHRVQALQDSGQDLRPAWHSGAFSCVVEWPVLDAIKGDFSTFC